MDSETTTTDVPVRARSSLIFISHDTRDAELAEAFSRLLSSVSAGVLKSFRSSDKKGNQGIEYGVEWFPEIMKKLEVASDVVCLLTQNSINRPWILYEAGVAKGKLETPVHGIALGISLQAAASGPFAQFQNSDDSEDSLTQLVMQLVRRIPNAEPDREVVRGQVATFRGKALQLTTQAASVGTEIDANDSTSVAKLFEEVKVMFQDLPGRIERRVDPEYGLGSKRVGRHQIGIVHELMHMSSRDSIDAMPLIITSSYIRDQMPWLYEASIELQRRIIARDSSTHEALEFVERAFEISTRHPAMRELFIRGEKRRVDFDEIFSTFHEGMSRLRDRLSQKPFRDDTAHITA